MCVRLDAHRECEQPRALGASICVSVCMSRVCGGSYYVSWEVCVFLLGGVFAGLVTLLGWSGLRIRERKFLVVCMCAYAEMCVWGARGGTEDTTTYSDSMRRHALWSQHSSNEERSYKQKVK